MSDNKCTSCHFGEGFGAATICSRCVGFSMYESKEQHVGATVAIDASTSVACGDKDFCTAKAADFLTEAGFTMRQRGATYDTPEGERSMGKAVASFNTITGRDLTEAEGWLLLQQLKDVRQWSKPEYHHDSALDSVAYAALKSEALAALK